VSRLARFRVVLVAPIEIGAVLEPLITQRIGGLSCDIENAEPPLVVA